MKYQIDQSGKIEQTGKNTVIAFANSEVGAIILSRKEKRHLIEYPGHTKIIEKMYNTLSRKNAYLHWQLIGRSSRAHDIAYKVYAGKLKIGRSVKAVEVWRLVRKTIAGGRLKTGLSPANRHSAPANKKR